MNVSQIEEQTILLSIEGILNDYDEHITRDDLLSIANKLDTAHSSLNFVLSCTSDKLTVSYFDDQGQGGRFHFGLYHRSPIASRLIN